ncbi:hypothetical protein U1Q18_037454 [Sarracenia purpurea var. burkii]
MKKDLPKVDVLSTSVLIGGEHEIREKEQQWRPFLAAISGNTEHGRIATIFLLIAKRICSGRENSSVKVFGFFGILAAEYERDSVKKQRRLGLKISSAQSRHPPSPSSVTLLEYFDADRQEGFQREGVTTSDVWDRKTEAEKPPELQAARQGEKNGSYRRKEEEIQVSAAQEVQGLGAQLRHNFGIPLDQRNHRHRRGFLDLFFCLCDLIVEGGSGALG